MRTTSPRHNELMHRPVRVKRFGRIVCGTIIDTVVGRNPDGSDGDTYVGILPRAAQDVEISGEWINLNEVEFENAPVPTPPATTDRTPLSALKSAEAYCDHLADQTRHQLDQAARTPALDCADLCALFQADKDAAWQQLAGLNERQLVVEAHAMASYLSSEGRVVEAEVVLARWQAGLARRAEAGPTRVEAAVMGALERLADENARSARMARAQGLREDAAFWQRACTAYTNALIEYRRGVRPERLPSGAWLLPSRRAGEAPHIVRMDGDWMCDCKASSSMHWPIAMVIGIEVGMDDLDGYDCGETAAEPPAPAPLGQRLVEARAALLAA